MRYSKEELCKIITDCGLTIVDESQIKSSNDAVHCITSDGYHVRVIPTSLIRSPGSYSIFSKYNPYSIQNIRHYFEINNIDLQILSEEFNNSGKMRFRCSCGKEFETQWNTILSKHKHLCNDCARSNYSRNIDYFNIIKKVCDDSNYSIEEQVIPTVTTTFNYRCNIHPEYIQHSTVDQFINMGKQCKYCAFEKRAIKKSKPDEEIKAKVENLGLIFVKIERQKGNKTRVFYQCKKHIDKGVFQFDISNLNKHSGKCPYCVNHTKDEQNVIEIIQNNNYNYELVEYRQYSDITIKCNNCGNVWHTSGTYLLNHGCPKCNRSHMEREMEKILIDNNIEYQTQYTFSDCVYISKLKFDFYLPNENVAIETDGEQHYHPVNFGGISDSQALEQYQNTKERDEIKNKYCKDNNIKLIRIPYWEKDNIEKYFFEQYNHCIS